MLRMNHCSASLKALASPWIIWNPISGVFCPQNNMLIGIDASRANEQTKTGTEWYSYHLIQELKKIDTENQYILYSKQSLADGLELLPPLWRNKVLGWPPQKLWTQFRLSWEMMLHRPDLLL